MGNDLRRLAAALAFVLLAASAQAPPPAPAEAPPSQDAPRDQPQDPSKLEVSTGPDGRRLITDAAPPTTAPVDAAPSQGLRALLDRLTQIQPASPNRLGWPPSDLCPECQKTWQLVQQVFDRRGWEQMEARGRSRDARLLLCQRIQELTQWSSSEMDRRFGYYRWTRTRHAIGASIEGLRDPVFQRLCR